MTPEKLEELKKELASFISIKEIVEALNKANTFDKVLESIRPYIEKNVNLINLRIDTGGEIKNEVDNLTNLNKTASQFFDKEEQILIDLDNQLKKWASQDQPQEQLVQLNNQLADEQEQYRKIEEEIERVGKEIENSSTVNEIEKEMQQRIEEELNQAVLQEQEQRLGQEKADQQQTVKRAEEAAVAGYLLNKEIPQKQEERVDQEIRKLSQEETTKLNEQAVKARQTLSVEATNKQNEMLSQTNKTLSQKPEVKKLSQKLRPDQENNLLSTVPRPSFIKSLQEVLKNQKGGISKNGVDWVISEIENSLSKDFERFVNFIKKNLEKYHPNIKQIVGTGTYSSKNQMDLKQLLDKIKKMMQSNPELKVKFASLIKLLQEAETTLEKIEGLQKRIKSFIEKMVKEVKKSKQMSSDPQVGLSSSPSRQLSDKEEKEKKEKKEKEEKKKKEEDKDKKEKEEKEEKEKEENEDKEKEEKKKEEEEEEEEEHTSSLTLKPEMTQSKK